MATLSPARIYQLARGAGLAHEPAITATAIALAESGGRTDAVGDVALEDATWGPSVGLWQVRSVKAQRGTGNVRDVTRLPDPKFNARSMASISSKGAHWSPWSTFKSGAYRAHLGAARAGASAVASTPPGQDIPTSPTAPLPGGGSTAGDDGGGFDWSPLPGDSGLPGYGDDLLGAAGDAVTGAVVGGVILAAVLGLGATLIVLGAWRAVQ